MFKVCIRAQTGVQKFQSQGPRTGARMPEVLLAEDNPADVRLIRTALKEHQVVCNVHLASDGEQVMELIAGRNASGERPLPDMIILDLNLPRHNGIEVLESLRASARWCGV